MDATQMAQITAALDQAAPLVESGRKDPAAAARLRGLADAITPRGTDQTAKRMRGLKETLTGIAAIVG
jgi:Flp pilus assembly CpaE family ATPase